MYPPQEELTLEYILSPSVQEKSILHFKKITEYLADELKDCTSENNGSYAI